MNYCINGSWKRQSDYDVHLRSVWTAVSYEVDDNTIWRICVLKRGVWYGGCWPNVYPFCQLYYIWWKVGEGLFVTVWMNEKATWEMLVVDMLRDLCHSLCLTPILISNQIDYRHVLAAKSRVKFKFITLVSSYILYGQSPQEELRPINSNWTRGSYR